jgi:uncharacterized protein (DUF1015 family)
MARVFPFQPYRYSAEAGRLEDLLTQPYDKITPEMQARYLGLSPYNLVRVELGPVLPGDDESNNVYTRAAAYLREWIERGVLVRESRPALFACYQEFDMPEGEGRFLRKGFIGLGALEDYGAGVVYRHEQTLSAPKQDRMELLERTRTVCGPIFMLYPDPEGRVEKLLDEACQGPPVAEVRDEYGALHRLWRIAEPERIAAIQRAMADKKLLIADGHHRYETALTFWKRHPELPGADKAMMMFVNLHSPGLKILATHRLVAGLANFDRAALLARLREHFALRELESLEQLRAVWSQPEPSRARIGLKLAGDSKVYLLQKERGERLTLEILHAEIFRDLLGISEADVREQRFIRYVRGMEPAVAAVERGEAQMAWLVEPVAIEDVARIAFSGGVMPQKSTDFYPKLLSGLTIYRLGE